MDERKSLPETAHGEEVLLKADRLCKRFGANKAVDDVSFEIRRGEVFGLVGESGCGKTTLGRTLIGLYEPTSGSVIFKGKRTEGRRFGGGMQMIFQDPSASLDPRMTVHDIVAEGLIIRGGCSKQEIGDRVREMLKLTGLAPEHAGRYPHELSGGQRQRVGIARAVIMQPELLIADEPISALDVSVRAQIINLLNDLKDRFGMTVLFIAHDLTAVRYFCRRVAVMYRGRIVELAASDELFREPLHPYTRSLLSAVPIPDPAAEKQRKRIAFDPLVFAGREAETASFNEVRPGHFVLCRAAGSVHDLN